MKVALTLNEINRMRHSITGGSIKVKNIVEALMDNIVEGESVDYMMAQYALIAGYLLRVGQTELGKYYIQKTKYYSDYAVDRISLIDVYVLSGNYEYLVDNSTQAASWYYRALELSEAIGYDGELARLYNNIGSLFLNNKDYNSSLEYFLLSEKYSQRFRDKRNLPILYNNFSELFLLSGKYDEAELYIERASYYVNEFGTSIRRLNLEINKWRYALAIGNTQESLDRYENSRTLLEKLPDGNDKIVATLAIFDNLVKMDMCGLAVHKLESDIQYLEDINEHYNLKKFYSHLVEYYEAIEDDRKRQYYITKVYRSDTELSKELCSERLKSLKTIDREYKLHKVEMKEIVTTVTALNEENKQLIAVNNNLRAIHDIGISILSTTDFQEIYQILLCKVHDMFQVNQFGISIFDEDSNELIFNYTFNENDSHIKNIRLSLDDKESYSVKAFLENKEIVINDLERESPKNHINSLKYGEQVASLIYIPIVINDKPFGVMTIQHQQKNAFTPLHLEVFRLLGTFASVSFKNAQHNKTLNDINSRLDFLAQHDELTTLYNRRTFEKVYGEAHYESIINESPLTVMILDIDEFKQYNDYYGHLMGDKCLTKIAKALQNELKRSKDLIARYGGDEFMIILPDTDLEGAEYIASTLMEAISNLKIEHSASKVSSFVTISIGAVSSVIADNSDKELMLIAADKALYKAKNELGRNQYYVLSL